MSWQPSSLRLVSGIEPETWIVNVGWPEGPRVCHNGDALMQLFSSSISRSVTMDRSRTPSGLSAIRFPLDYPWFKPSEEVKLRDKTVAGVWRACCGLMIGAGGAAGGKILTSRFPIFTPPARDCDSCCCPRLVAVS